MAPQPFWEWVISPNHNEIVVDLPTDTPTGDQTPIDPMVPDPRADRPHGPFAAPATT